MCAIHGGRAPQTRQKAEQRIALWEVQQGRAADTVVIRREPEELLLDALHDTNAVLTRIKADLQDGVVNPILLELAGDWLDRLTRIGKVVTDGDLATKLHERMGWMAEDRAAQLTAVLAAVLQAAPLSAQQRLETWMARFDGLQAIRDGRLPLRMLAEATADFTERLQVEAAREEAAVEGMP